MHWFVTVSELKKFAKLRFACWCSGSSVTMTEPHVCLPSSSQKLQASRLFVRPFLGKIEMATRTEKEEKDAQLARNVRQADLEQLLSRLANDLSLLKDRKDAAPSEAVENALDMKYLRDRQECLSCLSYSLQAFTFGV